MPTSGWWFARPLFGTIERMPFYEGARGRMHYRRWPVRSGPTIGSLVLLHGRGQHSALYHHLARRVTAAGFETYGLDLLGHGLSEGHPEDASPIDGAQDVIVVAESVAAPRVLLGHSLGAATAIATVLADGDWDAVVLCGTPAQALTSAALDRLERVPTLFVHGADDRMTPVDPLLDAIGTRAVTVEVFRDAGHDLFHEPIERRVTERLIAFATAAR